MIPIRLMLAGPGTQLWRTLEACKFFAEGKFDAGNCFATVKEAVDQALDDRREHEPLFS